MRSLSKPRLGALLLAALVVGSVVVGTQAVAATADAGQMDDESGEDYAEDVYVRDDGDVVAVYPGDGSVDGETNAEYGFDVGSGLFYALVTTSIDDNPGVTGSLSASMSESAIGMNGSLTADRPPILDAFSLNVTSVSNSERARMDGRLDAQVTTGFSMGIESASTNGNLTVSADRFQSAGTFSADLPRSMQDPAHVEMAISETDGDYEISVAQERTVPAFMSDQWETRSAAKAAIESQLRLPAPGMPAPDVRIEEYSFTEVSSGERQLDIAYTATLRDADAAMSRLLAQAMVSEWEIEGGQSVGDLAASIEAVDVETISFAYESRGGSMDASYQIDVRNYQDATLALLDAMGSAEMVTMPQSALEDARSSFQALSASGLEQRFTWDGSLRTPQDGTLTLDGSMAMRSENWPAYVSELTETGVAIPTSTFSLTGETTDEEIHLDTSMRVSQPALLDTYLNQLRNFSTMDEEAREGLAAFRDAELTSSQLSGELTADSLRFEAGAKFDELGSFNDVMSSASEVPDNIASMVGRTDGDTVKSYVHLRGAVESGASEDAVRELKVAGPDTEIHMPGSYDRDFPSMDTARASEYLGVPDPANQTTNDSGPGFGVAVALVALVATLLVARRRR
jgi:PGF-CTERM protein